MTSIASFQQTGSNGIQLSQPKVAVGKKVVANVLGATRHGLSILIGQDAYQLSVPSRIAGAKTLTLQGTASSSRSGQQIEIVAQDNRPLPKPITAYLTAGAKASNLTASTIVQQSQIEVHAQPIGSDGNASGSRIALNLQLLQPESGGKATSEAPHLLEQQAKGGLPKTPPRTLTTVDGRSRSPSAAFQLPGLNAVHGPDTGQREIQPNGWERTGPGEEVAPKLASNSAKSAGTRSSQSNAGTAGRQQYGGLSGPAPTESTSSKTHEGDIQSIKKPALEALSEHRLGPSRTSATEFDVPLQKTRMMEFQGALDRNQTVVATVTERGKDGKIVLKAGEQLLRVEQPVDLPVGMRLQISAAANMPIAVLSADINFSDDRTGPLAKLIELLDGIDRAVRQPMTSGQPAPAGQLPAPGKHLASRFLGLLALGNAQPKQEQPSSPDQGGVAVTQRSQIQALIHDLGAMSSESAEEGWKSFTLPIGLDHNEAVCCYFRDHAPDPDHEEGEGEFDRRDDARRAVFDVSFSRLGRCQIDAFCRQQRFDLLIRSETALLQPVQDDIAMLFGSACEIAGMNGEIAFRIGGFFEPSRSPTIVKALET